MWALVTTRRFDRRIAKFKDAHPLRFSHAFVSTRLRARWKDSTPSV